MRPVKNAASHKNVARECTHGRITTNSVHADKEREIAMKLSIELTNTIASVAWALVVFLLGGISLTRKK
jgi:hypothetical protein